ncbi:alpha/beta fold hydrolase [Tateyamaria omphalii]|uniref:Lysophospholipase n=1 Tax=Tateyamaria omphalii TaxID=299262 RepID=A0A1P8MUW8_9RHOB|nr:alpha/beta hydrolase [Tateyamaria omphalii]APX11890.1 lysophospholipase [Tateyamaria omphalii]
MTLDAAPLFIDVHPAPLTGAAYWTTAADGVRIRVGCWQPDPAKGTVLLFPGRTEYVEKYAPSAAALAARGFATLAVDWRGQGLADRLHEDRRLGHVNQFLDYQQDVAAVLDAARTLGMPEPYFMLGHSMGGCIGLRALYDGLPVNAAGFTGPMWGIRISPHLRPVAWALGHMMPVIGQGHRLPPGTIIDSYILTADFDDNLLTTDVEMFDMMRDQLTAHPDLALGGPSFVWLREALQETLALSRMPAPNLPCDTFVGTNERIVHVGRIHQRMDSWDDGNLHLIQNGEHEVLMEDARTRAGIFDTLAHRFADAA